MNSEFSKLGQINREYILSTVQPVLLNTSHLDAFNRNGYVLKVLRNFIVIFYIPVNNNDGSMASIKINNILLHFFDISLEELYSHAIRNIGTYEVLYPLDDAIAHILNYCKAAENNTESDVDTLSKVYVLSNTDNTDGAAVILNRDVLSRVHEIFNGHPYYLLPSSIHEMLAVDSYKASAKELQDIVISVNHDVVQPDEYLSDLILYCDSCQLYELDCRHTLDSQKINAVQLPV